MSFGDQIFQVDIVDTSGDRVGDGPLFNVISVELEEVLDAAGRVTITVPAHDERAVARLSSYVRVRVLTIDGQQATGLIDTFNVIPGGTPLYSVSGHDLLGELAYLNCGYNRTYNDKDVATEIIGTHATATSLLGGTNWTQGSVEDYGDVSIAYDAESRLRALILLAQEIGRHIRQGSTERTLDFGTFGAHSNIRVTNVDGFRAGMGGTTDIAYATQPKLQYVSADVQNVLFPLGKDRFDMRDASAASANIKVATSEGPTGAETTVAVGVTAADTSFTVASAAGISTGDELWVGDKTDWTNDHEVVFVTNVAGAVITILDQFANNYAIGQNVIRNPQFYIQNAASIATYGSRVACPQFSWIGNVDVTGDVALQQKFADSLYAAANAHLTRYKDEYTNFLLPNVLNLPADLRVGKKIRFVYKGIIGAWGGTLYVDVNDDFYVLKILRKFQASGVKTTSLEIVNVNRPTPNNLQIVLFNLDTNRWIGLG